MLHPPARVISGIVPGIFRGFGLVSFQVRSGMPRRA